MIANITDDSRSSILSGLRSYGLVAENAIKEERKHEREFGSESIRIKNRILAEQRAERELNSNFANMSDSGGIDPDDTTPSFDKDRERALGMPMMKVEMYKTGLLERLLENSSSSTRTRAEAQYRSESLRLLSSIDNKLDKLGSSSTSATAKATTNANQGYKRRLSAVAQAFIKGDLKGATSAIMGGIAAANGYTEAEGMLQLLPALMNKEMLTSLMSEKITDAVHSLLPDRVSDKIKQATNDPAAMIQNMIDGAFIKGGMSNKYLREHVSSGGGVSKTSSKQDLSASAALDRRLYMTITDIPIQIARLTSIISGKEAIVLDHETGKYVPVSQMTKKSNEMSKKSHTNSGMNTINDVAKDIKDAGGLAAGVFGNYNKITGKMQWGGNPETDALVKVIWQHIILHTSYSISALAEATSVYDFILAAGYPYEASHENAYKIIFEFVRAARKRGKLYTLDAMQEAERSAFNISPANIHSFPIDAFANTGSGTPGGLAPGRAQQMRNNGTIKTITAPLNKTQKAQTFLNMWKGSSDENIAKEAQALSTADIIPFIQENGNLDVPGFLATIQASKALKSVLQTDTRMTTVRDTASEDSLARLEAERNAMKSVLEDPSIGREFGLDARVKKGALGVAMGKLLNQTGVVSSPRLGMLMGGLGTALMMSSRAATMTDAMFGPEGGLIGSKGQSLKEQAGKKLVGTWMPFLGVGGKTAATVMKGMSAMGPFGSLMGLVAAPVLGIISGAIAGKAVPAIGKWAGKMFFDEDTKRNNWFTRGVGGIGQFILKVLPTPIADMLQRVGMGGEQKDSAESIGREGAKKYMDEANKGINNASQKDRVQSYLDGGIKGATSKQRSTYEASVGNYEKLLEESGSLKEIVGEEFLDKMTEIANLPDADEAKRQSEALIATLPKDVQAKLTALENARAGQNTAYRQLYEETLTIYKIVYPGQDPKTLEDMARKYADEVSAGRKPKMSLKERLASKFGTSDKKKSSLLENKADALTSWVVGIKNFISGRRNVPKAGGEVNEDGTPASPEGGSSIPGSDGTSKKFEDAQRYAFFQPMLDTITQLFKSPLPVMILGDTTKMLQESNPDVVRQMRNTMNTLVQPGQSDAANNVRDLTIDSTKKVYNATTKSDFSAENKSDEKREDSQTEANNTINKYLPALVAGGVGRGDGQSDRSLTDNNSAKPDNSNGGSPLLKILAATLLPMIIGKLGNMFYNNQADQEQALIDNNVNDGAVIDPETGQVIKIAQTQSQTNVDIHRENAKKIDTAGKITGATTGARVAAFIAKKSLSKFAAGRSVNAAVSGGINTAWKKGGQVAAKAGELGSPALIKGAKAILVKLPNAILDFVQKGVAKASNVPFIGKHIAKYAPKILGPISRVLPKITGAISNGIATHATKAMGMMKKAIPFVGTIYALWKFVRGARDGWSNAAAYSGFLKKGAEEFSDDPPTSIKVGTALWKGLYDSFFDFVSGFIMTGGAAATVAAGATTGVGGLFAAHKTLILTFTTYVVELVFKAIYPWREFYIQLLELLDRDGSFNEARKQFHEDADERAAQKAEEEAEKEMTELDALASTPASQESEEEEEMEEVIKEIEEDMNEETDPVMAGMLEAARKDKSIEEDQRNQNIASQDAGIDSIGDSSANEEVVKNNLWKAMKSKAPKALLFLATPGLGIAKWGYNKFKNWTQKRTEQAIEEGKNAERRYKQRNSSHHGSSGGGFVDGENYGTGNNGPASYGDVNAGIPSNATATDKGGNVKNGVFRPEVEAAIINAVTQVPSIRRAYMRVICYIESKGDPRAKSPLSTASGLFQFIRKTAAAYKLTNVFDPFANALAGAQFARDNRSTLIKLGKIAEPSDFDLYMAHQQGAGGYLALLGIGSTSPPSQKTRRDNMGKKAHKAHISNQEFLDYWKKKFTDCAKLMGYGLENGFLKGGEDGMGIPEGTPELEGDVFSDAGNSPTGVNAAFNVGTNAMESGLNTYMDVTGSGGGIELPPGDPNSSSGALQTALQEEGYFEKRSEKDLYDKTGNPGFGNYTKFAKEAGHINGKAWCATFVDWAFQKTYGREMTDKLIGPKDNAAWSGASRDHLMRQGRWVGKNEGTAMPGDIIHFTNGSAPVTHVGIVVKDNGDSIETIEGNTGKTKIHGGMVTRKNRPRKDVSGWKMLGFGRPDYSLLSGGTTPTPGATPAVSTYLPDGVEASDGGLHGGGIGGGRGFNNVLGRVNQGANFLRSNPLGGVSQAIRGISEGRRENGVFGTLRHAFSSGNNILNATRGLVGNVGGLFAGTRFGDKFGQVDNFLNNIQGMNNTAWRGMEQVSGVINQAMNINTSSVTGGLRDISQLLSGGLVPLAGQMGASTQELHNVSQSLNRILSIIEKNNYLFSQGNTARL